MGSLGLDHWVSGRIVPPVEREQRKPAGSMPIPGGARLDRQRDDRRGTRRGHTGARGPRSRRGARPAPPPAPSIYKAPPSRYRQSMTENDRVGWVNKPRARYEAPRLRDQI